MESRTRATAHVGRSWIAYQRIYKFSATYRVIPCCCQLSAAQAPADVSQIIEQRSIRAAAYVAWSWIQKPMGVTWCSLVIGSRFIGRTMNNDDRWPLPGSRIQPQTHSGLLQIPFTLLCSCISHSTPAITLDVYQVFYEVLSNLGRVLERSTRRNLATSLEGA